jgi:hypothetical protein
MDKQKISYSGVILDDKSVNILKSKFENLLQPGWKFIGHHMTIRMGELPEDEKSEIGKNVTLRVIKIGLSDKALAAMVDGYPSSNSIPHITIAVNDSIGAKPKDSNTIKIWKDISQPFEVTGIVEEIPFQVKINEKVDESSKVLNVFDFDGTLADSPTPETGKIEYEKITGKQYPHQGWWGKEESLTPFDVKIHQPVYNKYLKHISDPNSYNVLLTSRIPKLKPVIKDILDKNNIVFDDYLFKDGMKEKPEVIKELLKKIPDIKEINIYDDRDKELKLFYEFKEEMELSGGPNVNVFPVKI